MQLLRPCATDHCASARGMIAEITPGMTVFCVVGSTYALTFSYTYKKPANKWQAIYKHNEKSLSPVSGNPHIAPAGMTPVAFNPHRSVSLRPGPISGSCYISS